MAEDSVLGSVREGEMLEAAWEKAAVATSEGTVLAPSAVEVVEVRGFASPAIRHPLAEDPL